MRILASLPLYVPRSRVGAWISTHECLAYLVTRGHQVDVITQLGNGAHYRYDGVVVHASTEPAEPLARDADLVLSHLGDRQRGARLAAFVGRPSIRMVHGHQRDAASLLHDYPPVLAVYNSTATASAVGWRGPHMILYPPVFPSRYRTTPGDRVTLVNLSIPKGGALFDLLARALPDTLFLGARGGYGAQTARTLPNVEHTGPTGDMAGDVYRRTRILLMPSVAESWGRTGIEAMVSGIPVIAHPTPGLQESLGYAGIFIDRADLTAWRHAIEALADPDQWQAASTKALQRVAELDPAGDLERFEQALLAVA